MEPTTQPIPPREASPADVDRAFDDMARPGRAEEALRTARTYLEQHKIVATAAGFGLGFVLGRLLRRR
jgi:hypothetical protein